MKKDYIIDIIEYLTGGGADCEQYKKVHCLCEKYRNSHENTKSLKNRNFWLSKKIYPNGFQATKAVYCDECGLPKNIYVGTGTPEFCNCNFPKAE